MRKIQEGEDENGWKLGICLAFQCFIFERKWRAGGNWGEGVGEGTADSGLPVSSGGSGLSRVKVLRDLPLFALDETLSSSSSPRSLRGAMRQRVGLPLKNL